MDPLPRMCTALTHLCAKRLGHLRCTVALCRWQDSQGDRDFPRAVISLVTVTAVVREDSILATRLLWSHSGTRATDEASTRALSSPSQGLAASSGL